MRKLHDRAFSRMMPVLFAVQVMMGGFCLLTIEAQAMPRSGWTQHMPVQDVHLCGAGFSQIIGPHGLDQHDRDYSGSCDHCDQPDQLSHVIFLSVAQPALSGSSGQRLVQISGSDATGLFTKRTATGPPRSSSLLYTLTQRIRV